MENINQILFEVKWRYTGDSEYEIDNIYAETGDEAEEVVMRRYGSYKKNFEDVEVINVDFGAVGGD